MDICFTIMYVFEVKTIHFVEIIDLVGLTCSAANHMGCSNCATTYVDN